MPYNGSGSFSVYTPGTPYVTGTTISSATANAVNTDFATGLSTAICKDGQTTITADLPMAGFKHTGVAVASALTDYLRADQAVGSTPTYLTGTAGTNTITASAAIAPSAYATGQSFTFIPANTNTGATTINISSLGAKNIFAGGVACVGGELTAGLPYVLTYDGTQFNIQGAPIKFTFTPTLISSGGGTPTYTTQYGVGVKVGTRVFFTAKVILATYGTLASGNLTIGTLPYTSGSTSGNDAALAISADALDSAVANYSADIANNQTVIRLWTFAAGNRTLMTKANTSATAVFEVAGSYLSAS